ncbi:DUF1329 domain-containing protein, partial [Arenimonas sp.]|uniref:DUF1329 domain-containing protein n=1 Tax=Arenimonas sp. TaxID=1872635 RepID=UPI0025BE452D
MKIIKKHALTALVGAIVLGTGAAQAAVSAQEAAKLGQSLTPVGAEKAGNAAGTIPAWEGGIVRPPAGFRVGTFHPDPFAADKALYSVTRANVAQYGEVLTPGQKAMFAKYPTFRMDVYPTRRSASFPQRTYDFTKRNATQCKLVANGEGIQNCAEGIPFPIPQNAYELIWNHKLKYKGLSVVSYSNQAAPTAGGAFTLIKLREEILGL